MGYGFEAKLWTLEVSLVGVVFPLSLSQVGCQESNHGQYCDTGRAVVINRLPGSVLLESLYFVHIQLT